MKYKASIYTLALLGALALAALSGGLLPSDNAVYAQTPPENRPPAFADETDTRSIRENTPPGVNLDDPITATDPDEDGQDDDDREFGDTLTYSLEGMDAASFNLDPSTGQLSTKAALDLETKASYEVTVRVRDSRGGTDTIVVTINVDDDATEPPAAPAPPTVTSGPDDTSTQNTNESTTTLKVLWHPPENTGDPTIRDYDYRYKTTTDTVWTVVENTTITERTVSIRGLTANTSYLVSVRATSAEGTSPWSLSGTGSTNRTRNSPPTFGQTALLTPTVPENSPARQNVGVAVRAHDGDTGILSYRLDGPDADSFDFITSSGQIRTKRGVTYNHEDPGCGYDDTFGPTVCTYYVTVAAFDGAGGSDAIRVEIKVTDQPETPSAPGRPTVRATERSSTSLDVSWSEPSNAGPPITGYNVQYRRKGSNDEFSSDGVPGTVTGTSTTISGVDSTNDDTPWLTRGTAYEVRVQATSDEGLSPWSTPGTGSTDLGNLEPVFRERPNSGSGSVQGTPHTLTRTVRENTPPGTSVGRAVTANDGNGDKRTYKLIGDDVASFDIDESTGQIKTKELLNHEDVGCGYDDTANPTVCTHTVTVEVRDGLDANSDKEESEMVADDTITVEVTVIDLPEPPSPPPVTVTSPTNVTTLDVTWNATANTGPDITGYDVEYRRGSDTYSNDNCGREAEGNCTGIDAGTTRTTIQALDANTSYSVRVRAKNAEGDSAWSSVTGKTNRNKSTSPDVPNEVPTFDSGNDTPQVQENTSAGQNVDSRVSADDSDGGTLIYSLEGPDKNSFTIERTTGQIRTKSSLNYEEKTGFTVRVKVVDGQGGSASQM